MENGKKLIFTSEDGEKVEFYILEQTTVSGNNYLLVADRNENEANALILKEVSVEDSEDAVYDVVEDAVLLEALSKIFTELMDDLDIEID